MAVKKKVQSKPVSKKSPPPKKMSAAEAQAFAKKTSDAIQGKTEVAGSKPGKKTRSKEDILRLKQVLENPAVKVELADEGATIRLEETPISATIHEGLVEYKVEGTHLRLLCMEDPSKTPTTDQRVHMAKRLNEVGPFLPRYIKTVSFLPGKGVSDADIEAANSDGSKDPEVIARRAAREERNKGGHNWVKQNLVSNSDGSDDYACENEGCAKKFKRRGLEWNPPAGDCGATQSSGRNVSQRAARATVKAAAGIEGGIPLKKICSEVDIDPKDARRCLRAKKVEKPGGRWEWTPERAEEIKTILRKERDDIAKNKS